MRFKTKPVIVDAVQWNMHGDHPRIIPHPNETEHCWTCGGKGITHGLIGNSHSHIVCPGDWIVEYPKGVFTPMKPEEFEKTYDRIFDTGGEGMKNQELLDELNKFPKDLEVVFATDYEVCGDDEHTYWKSESVEIKIGNCRHGKLRRNRFVR
jgi:hypothetical protein